MDKTPDHQRLSKTLAKKDAATRLAKSKQHILSVWESRVRECVPAARLLGSTALWDSLPKVLDKIANALAHPEHRFKSNEIELAREHGEVRSQQAYDLAQVVDEYQVLRQVLFDVLREGGELLPSEQDIILDAIVIGVRNAAARFTEHRDAERSEANRQFRQTEARYQAVVEGIADHAIIVSDQKGIILQWNRGAEKIFGFSQDEILGTPARILFTQEDLAQDADQQEMRTAQTKGRAEDKRWHLKKDGSRFFANGIMNPLRDESGQLYGFVKVLRDDTQRIEIEEALKESETQIRAFAEAMPQMAFIADAEGRVLYLNRRHYEYFGLPAGDWIGWQKKEEEVHHPADRPATIKAWREALRSGRPFEIEYRLRRHDGEYRWHLGRATPHRDQHGRITLWYGTNTDIHDQKRLHEQLSETYLRAEAAREELHRLLMQAPAAICIVSGPEHRFTFANSLYERLVGRKVVGRTLYEAFTPEEVRHYQPVLEQVYRTGLPFAGKALPLNIPDENGVVQNHFVDLTYQPLRDGSGTITGIFALVLDVTDQVAAKNAIEESEARARQIANSLPLIVYTARPDGYVDWYNDWWYEYLGRPRGTAWDDEETAPMHPEDAAKTKLLWFEAVAAGRSFQMEQRFKRGSDGQYRWHLERAVPVRDASGRVTKYIGGNMDIHDQKLLAEELKQARLAAESANESKSSFLANMSHEIRTPMTAVLGFTEVLRDSHLTDEEREDALSRIDSSGRALLRVIDDVLDISKIEAGKLEIQVTRFSPIEVASDVVAILGLTAEQKGIYLRLIVDTGAPSAAHSDPIRLRQILMNLVGNAVKFTSSGGVTLLLTSSLPNCLIFEVSDTGIGISGSDQTRLFRPFAQADASITRNFGGTGLGLLLSRRLAEQLGGTLDLKESLPGKGSTFVVKIEAGPLEYVEGADTARDRQPRTKEPSASLSGVRILLAEDVPDNQVLMKRYLGATGAEVQIACNGVEAVAMASSNEFDIVLMDIQMPKLDGIQATRQLRGMGYDKPIVALTAHAMSEEVARSLKAGCNAHLSKPITKASLVLAIKSHIEK